MKQNESQLLGLITKIQEHLIQIDRKLDVLASRCTPKPPEIKPSPKPFQPPVSAAPDIQLNSGGGTQHHNHPKERIMHAAVCADCKQQCHIPFKPNGDRPVYCQECFKRRKSGGVFQAQTPELKKEAPPVMVAVNTPVKTSAVPVKSKKKPAAAKKAVGKKKPAPKKKK